MALNFPNSPTVGQQYVYPPFIYEWDGNKWITVAATSNPADELRGELALNTGAGMVGTTTGQTVQYELDNHTHTPAEAGALPVGGTAVSATKLATARSIALTGDVTGSVSFDGTANVSMTTAYKNSGVTAGTYKSVTVDAKGNITAGTNPTTLAGYGITDALSTTGNAASASKWLTPRNFTIGSTSKSVDGSANVTWTVGELGGQASDPTLTAMAGVATAADRIIYFNGVDTALATPLTAFGRSLIDDADAATARATIGAAATTHTHVIADVTSLQSSLDGKLDTTATAAAATKLATARTITLAGDVTGSVNFDGTANVSITAAVVDDSHNHTIANVDTLQTVLDGKVDLTGDTMTGQLTTRAASVGNGIVGTAQGGAFAAMWTRASPFRTGVVHTGSSYAPSLIVQYEYTGAFNGVYSIGHLTTSAANPGSFCIHHIDAAGANAYIWQFIGSTGELNGPGNGNFNDVYIRSDRRLKSNLVELESPLNKIHQLTGYTYDKKSNLNSDQVTREVGIIAQDLQKILPEAVSTSATCEDKLLCVSNSGVGALMVEAIKEIDQKYQSRIDELERQVSELVRYITEN